jgi:hypothetical protein
MIPNFFCSVYICEVTATLGSINAGSGSLLNASHKNGERATEDFFLLKVRLILII